MTGYAYVSEDDEEKAVEAEEYVDVGGHLLRSTKKRRNLEI